MICTVCNSQNEDTAENCFTCGQPLAAVITRGTLVAQRYEILSPLGRGGMGMVYKAHDRVLDETVALKVLRADIAQDPDMARRFRSEIRLARRVRHRNVCGIHEYGEDGRIHFIAMEYIEGIDLKKILKQTRVGMRSDEAFDVAIQVAEGLQAIHDVNIIHRDLKTPNIMRDTKGHVRLMDFGIAKESDAASGQTATGLIVGTPEYMSPEQARGERVDSRTDIYALGIVIFEIFTGEVPFHGETPLATIMKHLKDPPPVEVMDAHHLPYEARDVLLKALAKEPKDRYATAAALAEALRQARSRVQAQDATAGQAAAAPVQDRGAAAATSMRTPLPQQRVTPTPTPAARLAERPAPPPPTRAVRATRTTGSTGAVKYRTRQTPVWLYALPVVALAVIAGAVMAVWPEAEGDQQATTTTRLEASGTAAPATPAPAPSATSAPLDRPPSSEPSTAVAPPVQEPGPPPSAPTPRPERSSPPPPSARPTARAIATTALPTIPIVRNPSTPAPPPAATTGELLVIVTPWANVSLDGAELGATPVRTSLEPGKHDLILTHPEYLPVRRKVTVSPGKTARVEVDLSQDAVRKQQ